MSKPWTVCLPVDNAAQLGRLRARGSIRSCEQEDCIWIRGEQYDEQIDLQLRAIPFAERFFILEDEQLLPMDERVPRGHLPQGHWSPLQEWLTIQAPVPALAGTIREQVPISVVRSSVEKEANLLLTTNEEWQRYGKNAPLLRLNRWSFALNDQGEVLVRGTPLPPIPGERYVEEQGVAVLAGWTWSPAVDVEILREVLQVDKDDVALFARDGSWCHVAADSFVMATRSAIRLST